MDEGSVGLRDQMLYVLSIVAGVVVQEENKVNDA